MAIDLGLRIMQLLDSIGIKGASYLGKASNVKKAFTGGKPTFFKPDVLETLRSQNGTFTDALKLIEEEAKFIANATDVEKMAFLNNLMEYKSLGGPQKTKSPGLPGILETTLKNLKDESKDLQTSTEDLMSLAKKMKDEAETGKKKALQDLDDFFTTGGQPFKKKDNKFLGGSMHEESQLRTGIRQFLQTEYKEGRLKLNDLDRDRIMEYSPMIEHDPILVFKKIYGNDAYEKAGSFAGAFEKGENFKHYEQIFRENMGEDLLKVKNKEYVGDGTLVLTDEVMTPIPDDDVPFAKGGIAGIRQGYAGGLKVSKKILSALNSKNIKKAIDNIFKTGDYKYDASLAAESFVELNPQLFGGKLYDDLDQATQMKIYGAVLEPIQQDVAMALKIKKASKPTKTLEGIEKTGTINISDPEVAEEFARFMKETSPGDAKKVEQTVELSNFDTKGRKKNAGGGLAALLGEPQGYYTGGRAGFDIGGSSGLRSDPEVAKKINKMLEDELIKKQPEGILMDPPPRPNYELIEEMLNPTDKGLLPNNIIEFDDGTIFFKDSGEYYNQDGTQVEGPSKGSKIKPQIMEAAEGGRAGYYTGGMVDVEPNLSDIGHGSDSLMARTRLISPNNQATTSTGLNYLLAEDNDNIRVPFSKGKGVDLTRRGFLKIMGGTVGAIAALKSGVLKILGKGGTKTVPKIVEVGSGSGVPQWFEPMVNKVLADGLDVTKTNAVIDGQTVKRLKTDRGEIDVYHNERSGEIDVEYTSETHGALGEPVHLNYKPGSSMADEGNPSPPDEFMASEAIPEGRRTGPDDFEIEMGENTVDEVKDLYSDVSELQTLGGKKELINDISVTLQKKKKLKQMQDNPTDFVTDVQGDYDPT